MGFDGLSLLRIIKVENGYSKNPRRVGVWQQIHMNPQGLKQNSNHTINILVKVPPSKCQNPKNTTHNKIIQKMQQPISPQSPQPPHCPQSFQPQVLTLCEYLSNILSQNPNKMSKLITKSLQLGLPVSPIFTKQRYIYNIALALVTTIVEIQEGFVLAAVVVRDFGGSLGYWDVVGFLYQFRRDLLDCLEGQDQVIQRIQVYNIAICHDINTIYRCHCSLHNISHHHLTSSKKTTQPTPKKRQISHSILNSIGQKEKEVNEKMGQNRVLRSNVCAENQNRNKRVNIIKTVTTDKNYINLEADSGNQLGNQKDSGESVVEILEKIGRNQRARQFQENTVKKDTKATGIHYENRLRQLLNKRISYSNQKYSHNIELIEDSFEDRNRVRGKSSVDQLSQKRDIGIQIESNPKSVEPVNMNQFYEFSSQKPSPNPIQTPQKSPLQSLQSPQSPQSPQTLQRCQICLVLYHPCCQKTVQNFICNKCYLKQNSIKYRVISSLFTGYVHFSSYLTLVNFACPNAYLAKTQYCDSFIIQLRFLYFRGDDLGGVYLVDQKESKEDDSKKKKKSAQSRQNRPLRYKTIIEETTQIHSIKIPLKYLQQNNALIIQRIRTENKKKNAFTAPDQNIMLFGIYQVVPRSRRKQPINNSVLRLPEKASNLFYQSILAKSKEKYMRVSNLSGASNTPMSFPIRSFQCQHAACFDYSEMNVTVNSAKTTRYRKSTVNKGNYCFPADQVQQQKPQQSKLNPRRRIKRLQKICCPICQVQMKGIYLDSLMLQSIQQSKQHKKSSYLEIFRTQAKNQSIIEIIQQSNQILENPKQIIPSSQPPLQPQPPQSQPQPQPRPNPSQKLPPNPSKNEPRQNPPQIHQPRPNRPQIQYNQDLLEIVSSSQEQEVEDFYVYIRQI